MAMTILNNTASMMTLGELNKNITKVGKDLAKVSTGQRLKSYGDGASDVAISEKMRVKIRGLGQDARNVQTGNNLLQVAEGGMQNIVDELRNMKELALNSCNDHNTDADRATMQKEIKQKIQNIEDIAATTNYNGRYLLDGTWRMPFHEIRTTEVLHVDKIPFSTISQVQDGTTNIQVTANGPSVTKVKDPRTGNVMLRQDNSLTGLAMDFKPLYNTCREDTVRSGGGIVCDEGFVWETHRNEPFWSWGNNYVSKNSPTQLETIKAFNKALDNTTLSGDQAVDEAINAATNGLYPTLSALAADFMNDLNSSPSSSYFLEKYCGIDLDNMDTGSITGFDAGSKYIKNAEDVVPEYTDVETWGMPAQGSSTTFNGLKVNWPAKGVNNGFTQAEQAILKGLNSEWTKNSLDLINSSFGLNFNDSNTTVNEISVEFVNQNNNNLAWVTGEENIATGQTDKLTLKINMKYYEGIVKSDPNGSSNTKGAGYLDRTLAHEFTHAVMSANIDNFSALPKFIREGMAEVVHGIDDERKSAIETFSSSSGATYMQDMLNGVTYSNPTDLEAQVPYAGGYMFLRYMAEKGTGLSTVPEKNNQVAVDIDFSSFANGTLPDDFHDQGFSILCSGCRQFINIKFDMNLPTASSTFTRSPDDSKRSDYVIGIQGLTTVDDIEKAIFDGVAATNLTDRQHGYSDTLDISRTLPDGNGGTTTEFLNLVLDGDHGVRIAKKPEGNGYAILKDEVPLYIGIVDSGTILAVEAANTTDDLPPGTIDADGNEVIPINGPTPVNLTTPHYIDKIETGYKEVPYYTIEEEEVLRKGNPLYIHTGTRANQNLAFFINDMRPAAMGIDAFEVTTRSKATDSLEVLDNALQYSLDEVTRIGAYQSRLEHTLNNIVTTDENTQAAESTIRDADMAKEITSYTKNNVLAQASQAMLAQANQNSSSVLNLLQ